MSSYLLRLIFRHSLLLLAICAVGVVGAQTVTFHFNPPDGVSYLETTRHTTTEKRGDAAPDVEVVEIKTRVVMHKTPTGYTMVSTPITRTHLRNGHPQHSPSDVLWPKLILTYTLDAHGSATMIRGYDALPKLVRTLYPAEKARALLAATNTRALETRELAAWNLHLREFEGRSAPIGGGWTVDILAPLPSGLEAPARVTAHFVERTLHEGVSCVRIKLTQVGDPATLTASMNADMRNGVTPRQSAELPRVARLTVIGTGERLIDPGTLLLHQCTTTHTTTMQLLVPHRGTVTVVTVEKQESSYRFAQGAHAAK